jgi:hypothetical protein
LKQQHAKYFRRTLDLRNTATLGELLREIGTPSLNNSPIEFTWAFEPSGKFSMKSLYRKLSIGDPRKHYVVIWKIYVPLKIRIFLWQLSLKRLPSSDNIKKRHGSTNGNCTLCGEYEDTNHIFFQCAPHHYKIHNELAREPLGIICYPNSSIYPYLRDTYLSFFCHV